MIRVLNDRYRLEDIEPRADPLWRHASEAMRLEFWHEAGRIGLEAKQAELAGGLDRFGRRLLHVGPACWLKVRHSKFTPQVRGVPDDAAHPPLMPAGAASRTRAWLAWKADPIGVTFYWKGSWGRQLARHRDGHRAYIKACHRIVQVKPRDVIGLSEEYEAIVIQGMQRWWAANRHRVQVERARRKPPATRGEFELAPGELAAMKRGGIFVFQTAPAGPAVLKRAHVRRPSAMIREPAMITIKVPPSPPPAPPMQPLFPRLPEPPGPLFPTLPEPMPVPVPTERPGGFLAALKRWARKVFRIK
jgi:hypothetical protein